MRHTPGPWKVFKTGKNGPASVSFWIGKESKYPEWTGPENLGDLHSYSLYNGSSTEQDAEGNANLIAAAPELLIALEACIVALTLGPNVDEKAAVKYAEEILAKVRGSK